MSIQHLLEKQREEFEKNPLFRSGGFYPFKNDVKSFLSTIQQEILQATKEKIEGMKKQVNMEAEIYSPLDSDPACIHGWNEALSDLSSWLEGDKK